MFKMVKRLFWYHVVGVVMGLLVLSSCATESATTIQQPFEYDKYPMKQWKKLGSYADGNFSYDVTSIYSSADDNIRVLVKWVLSEKAKIDNVKKFGEEQKNVTHWVILYEWNCENKKYRILEISFWRKEHLSGGTGPTLTEWNNFDRDSPGELIYKTVCK